MSSKQVSRIVYTGFVEEIVFLYKQADLHVCPSLCEDAYDLTVVEAKKRKRPSIVFASGGFPEIVKSGKSGWVCEKTSTDALARAIAACEDNPGDCAAQGMAAYASLSEMGIPRFREKWREIYGRSTS